VRAGDSVCQSLACLLGVAMHFTTVLWEAAFAPPRELT
jgi:hypothetical protein